MPGQTAVGEAATVGLGDDVHDPARRDERPESAQDIAADLGRLGGGDHP